jgi:NO-binding membrane sensor protein with MHYT domain
MIEIEYNMSLVLMSYVIAVFGSYVALSLAIRIPAAEKTSDLLTWLTLAATAIGGGAIWSMHFIGMMAADMKMPMTYDIGLTVLSVVLAIISCAIGFFIVGRGASSVVKLATGGVITGLGVSAMHYTGMASMNMQATMEYDTALVVVSVLIGIAAAIASLWLAFNLRGNWQRFGSAFVMGIAVCGLHYTGMAALKIKPHTDAMQMSGGESTVNMGGATTIFLVAAAILSIFLVLTVLNSSSKKKDIVF